MKKVRGQAKLVQCEIYTRVTGYFRPVNQFNKGKREEFQQRASLLDDRENVLEALPQDKQS